MSHDPRKLLSRIRAFEGFTPAELDAFVGATTVRKHAAGALIFRQGDTADGCYLIAEGRVQISIARGSKQENLAMLGAGDFLGQMAVLDGGKRSATCTAIDASTLLYLGRDDLDLLIRGRSSFALKFLEAMTRMLVTQLRYANRRLLTLAQRKAPADEATLRQIAGFTGDVSLSGLDDMEVVTPDTE
jgi:CRP/FNR family transcriptional regulator, cyclic AMP receptor protein